MLKVVGASWLQTRISTYILVAVGLLGIGAIILGEFGHIENDGTYSASISWSHKGGYHIDFWGQGNDLSAIPLKTARAYYKAGIHEMGWSIIEIETSSKYPDAVQAYAAGYLEGSLTWQLIHHHWYNTVGVECERKPNECTWLKSRLRENSAIVRERANLLHSTEPFWHMVRLFYNQLDGLTAGWRHAVRRSRYSVEMKNEDFLWLAMAGDLPWYLNFFQAVDDNATTNSSIGTNGMIFLKALARADSSEPLIAFGHNTAAPYTKMLRLLKRYKFGYHVLPSSVSSTPSQSVVMSSYPGAISSHDEFYLLNGKDWELIVAGTPLLPQKNRVFIPGINSLNSPKHQVIPSSVRVMAANRLATDGRSWSQLMMTSQGGKTSGISAVPVLQRQWVTFEPRKKNLWLLEQLPGGMGNAADYSSEFAKKGFLSCTGVPHFRQIKEAIERRSRIPGMNLNNSSGNTSSDEILARLQTNLSTLDDVEKLMREYSHEESTTTTTVPPIILNQNRSVSNEAEKLLQALTYDSDKATRPSPIGVIDTKIVAVDSDGFEIFEAISGPPWKDGSFAWSETFPNVSHIGHPDVFAFDSVTPLWAWN